MLNEEVFNQAVEEMLEVASKLLEAGYTSQECATLIETALREGKRSITVTVRPGSLLSRGLASHLTP